MKHNLVDSCTVRYNRYFSSHVHTHVPHQRFSIGQRLFPCVCAKLTGDKVRRTDSLQTLAADCYRHSLVTGGGHQQPDATAHTSTPTSNAHVPHQQQAIGHRFLYRGADTYNHTNQQHTRATPTTSHWPPVSLQGRRHIQPYATSTRTCHINTSTTERTIYVPPSPLPSLPLPSLPIPLLSPSMLPPPALPATGSSFHTLPPPPDSCRRLVPRHTKSI